MADPEQARPSIRRRLDVRSDITLNTFHQTFQAVFDWTDSQPRRVTLGDIL